MKKKIVLMILLLGIGSGYAQETNGNQTDDAGITEQSTQKTTEKSHFMLRGFSQFGLDASSDNVEFNMTSFNPVLLWRQGDRFLFESELEMEYMSNQFSLNLGYASASYIITKGLTIKLGKILIPFGEFGEKLHPSWVNRLADAPLGLGHDGGMLPMADIGVEIRGGLPLGPSKLSYSLYCVNGPRLKDGTMGQEEAGMLSWENANDNNKNKALGTRIALLPFSNSSLEIGVSGYYAKPGSATSPFASDSMNMDLNYKDVTAMLTAVDLSFTRMVNPIKGMIDIKAQYNTSDVSDATYFNPNDTTRYHFTNKSTAWYGQLAYRPSQLDNKVLKNVEVVGRYSVYNTPASSLWHSEESQISIGLNYWFTWRTVLKICYQITDGAPTGMSGMSGMSGMGSTGSMGTSTINTFQIHLAMGL